MGKHALIAPSACGRIGYCPASVLLTKDLPNEPSQYAEEGTAAHRMAELEVNCLIEGKTRGKAELAEWEEINARYPGALLYIQQYADHIAELLPNALYKGVEVRLPLTPITGEPDAFGTADCLVIRDDTLHVIDLKYGAGVKVEAKENVQLCMYALAALEELDPDGMLYAVSKVELHIVQPRMENIDVWQISREALEHRFYPRIKASIDRALHLAEHPDELRVGFPFLVSGGAEPVGDFARPDDTVCRFCRAKATCPAMHQATVAALEQDFEDLPDTPKAELPVPVIEQIQSIPVPDTPERLATAYGWLKVIRLWADSVESRMYDHLGQTGESQGYKLVAGRPGPRKWDDAKEAEEILRRALTVDKAYDRKLISPTSAEKLHKKGDIGPKYWARLSNLMSRSDGKPQIVPSTDERAALVPQIENDFEDLANKAE